MRLGLHLRCCEEYGRWVKAQRALRQREARSGCLRSAAWVGGTHELAQDHLCGRAGFGRRGLKVSVFDAMSSRKGSGGGGGGRTFKVRGVFDSSDMSRITSLSQQPSIVPPYGYETSSRNVTHDVNQSHRTPNSHPRLPLPSPVFFPWPQTVARATGSSI